MLTCILGVGVMILLTWLLIVSALVSSSMIQVL